MPKRETRAVTPHELETAARMMAEGKKPSAISHELNISWGRAKTLTEKVAVMELAEKLRLTENVPAQMATMTICITQLLDLCRNVGDRLTKVEGEMRRMNKTVRVKTLQVDRQRETIRSLKRTEKELRAQMRKRGIPV